jgi:hypothetical protein
MTRPSTSLKKKTWITATSAVMSADMQEPHILAAHLLRSRSLLPRVRLQPRRLDAGDGADLVIV